MFKEIIEEIKTVFPIPEQIHTEITRIKDQTELIDYLFSLNKIAFDKKEETEGIESMEKVLRFVCIRTINLLWSEHLDTMESLKGSVRLRAYGGKDPLIEYKTEGNIVYYFIYDNGLELVDQKIYLNYGDNQIVSNLGAKHYNFSIEKNADVYNIRKKLIKKFRRFWEKNAW